MTTDQSNLGEDFPPGRHIFENADHDIRVVLDTSEFEFYLEASPAASPTDIDVVLDTILYTYGYELIDEDECPPEITTEGWTRIYATPIEPVDDAPLAPVRGVRRLARVFESPLGIFSGLGVSMTLAVYELHEKFGPAIDAINTGGSA